LFVRKALAPAFLTELATIPFGVVMALAFNKMGSLAFVFLGATLLFSNAVLKNLSLIRYDQEEKLRMMSALTSLSRQIIALRDDEAVIKLLYEEIGRILENHNLFLAVTRGGGAGLRYLNPVEPPLTHLGEVVATARQPVLITNTKKQAPEGLRKE